MPIARVIDEDERGGITFERDDGSTLYSFGAEARKLAERLQSQPDQRTAGTRSLATALQDKGMALDAGGGVGGGTAIRPESSKAPITRPGKAGPVQVQADPPLLAGGMKKTAPTARASMDKEALPELPIGDATAGPQPVADPYADEINAPVAMGGRPGVSQAQLQQRATQGVAMPAASTLEVSNAVPRNPETEEAYYDAVINERLTRQSIADRGMAYADLEAAGAAKQAADLKNQAVLQEAELEGKKAKAASYVAYVHDLDQRALAQKEDPSKFFSDRGAWAGIAAAVVQGLGAYGATIAGTKNFAGEMIEKGIERNVQKQRAEYLRNRDVRGNIVAELDRIYHDVDAATEGAKLLQHRQAMAYAAQLAAADKRGVIANNFALWEAENAKKLAEREQALYEKSLGNMVQRSSATIEYPRAATGGGYRAPTLKERAERSKYATEIEENERKRTGPAQVPQDDEKALQQLSKRLEPIVKLEQANQAVTGKGIEGTLSANVVPDAVAGFTGGGAVGEQRRAWNAWLNARANQLGGANMPPEEFARLRAGMENTLKTKQSREGALRDAERVVDEQKRTILSAYPERVRREWERRNKQVVREEARKGDGPKEKR